MTNNIPFDTLQYAQLLKTCGVDDPEGQSTALATVITQNIYTKNEVEDMIEAALKKFDERTYSLDKRIDLNFKEMENRIDKVDGHISKVDSRIDQAIARSVYKTIWVLGTLMIVISAISTLTHYIFH